MSELFTPNHIEYEGPTASENHTKIGERGGHVSDFRIIRERRRDHFAEEREYMLQQSENHE